MHCAEQSADAIARLLIECLAAAFPELCARYGDAEVCAAARVILPALAHEPTVTVRAHPATAAAVAREIARLDPAVAACVQIADSEGLARGDVRIAWRNGAATRDATALWRDVAAVLAPAGFLPSHAAVKETVDGC